MCGLQQYLIAFLACCVAVSYGASIPPKVHDMSNTGEPTGSDCEHRTPCAWGVYVPFTRRVDYYMKNTCKCPSDTACTRMEDDLAVSAYIYRCKKADPNATKLDEPFSEFPTKLPDWVSRTS